MTPARTNWQLALARFGCGARRGDGVRAGDPKEALLAELAEPRGAKIVNAELRSTPQVLQDVYAYELRRKTGRDFAAMAALTRSAMPTPEFAALAFPVASSATATGPEMTTVGSMPPAAVMQPETPPQQKAFRADAQARLAEAYAAPIGFVERLVAFWSNHFCVSVAKSAIGRGAAGAFEREAIRPHVLGRFADMLLAVERHPAMLNFLDNQQSIGPNSLAGHNNKSGLNENLAREILELHTMGVGSGYTQTDVTQLAYILTGWTIVGRDGKLGEPGTFVFNANAHEPTAATLLDRVYMQDGVAQGEAALAEIARDFVADAPDAGLVQRLAEVFRETDGDLAALARALVNDAVAWSAPPTKIRNPWEFTVAAYRAFARTPDDPGPALNSLDLLGMPLWQPGGPNGFSDESTAWSSPEGMKTRLQLAARFAHQVKDAPEPLAMIDDILGPNASAATRETVARAESREQAYALLLLSPEFQRR
jgi:uncharacterized protein (DUF1800 family)